MFSADEKLMEKWSPVLEHGDVPSIDDRYKKAVTARLLENQEVALQEERVHQHNTRGILIKVHRHLNLNLHRTVSFCCVSVCCKRNGVSNKDRWKNVTYHL